MREPPHKIALFSGNANPELAGKIAKQLRTRLGKIECGRFSDGEIRVHIQENVRESDVFVIQSVCPPQINENLMELLIILDAFRRASPRRITAVIPYYGYARQDRKDRPRVPITAKLIADLLTSAGAGRVLTMDLHADQIQGFFNVPVDHLYGSPTLVRALQRANLGIRNPVVVAPDVGSIKTSRSVAKRLGAELAIIDKRRPKAGESEVVHLIGEVRGRDAILFDDMVGTAGTLVNAARAVKAHGARNVYAAATHPVLSGQAVELIKGSVIKKLIVSDTIPLTDAAKRCKLIEVVSVAPVLAEAISRIATGKSVSSLFN